jgi:hypothetical protein
VRIIETKPSPGTQKRHAKAKQDRH